MPLGTDKICPQLGHLRKREVLRSFHIFWAVRFARSYSMLGTAEAAEPPEALRPAGVTEPRRATRLPRTGTRSEKERNALFSLQRTVMFLENARASASSTIASAIHVSGSRFAMVPMRASSIPAPPSTQVSSSTP